MSAVETKSGARNFDFWMGRWNVRNRRLRERLAGSDEWDEFEATAVARPLPGGLGNEDLYCTEFDGGFFGMSFRFFDPESGLWSIYWADSRRAGVLDPPVFGSFSGDTGVFLGEEALEFFGRPIELWFDRLFDEHSLIRLVRHRSTRRLSNLLDNCLCRP